MKLILLVVLLVKVFAREPDETSSLNMEATEQGDTFSSNMEGSEPVDTFSSNMDTSEPVDTSSLNIETRQPVDTSSSKTESQDPDDYENDDMSDLLGRTRWCKSRRGECIRKKTSCADGYQKSPKGKPYCKNKKMKCCYPITKVTTTTSLPTTSVLLTTTAPPTTKISVTTTTSLPTTSVILTTTAPPTTAIPGGSKFTSSGQRFQLLTDKYRTWDESQAACGSLGLQLAHPRDPIELRRTLVTNYGVNRMIWQNARGNGSTLAWLDTGAAISRSDPLWPYGPYTVYYWNSHFTTTQSCQALAAWVRWLNDHPNAPYHISACLSSGWSLCQH